MAWRVQQSGRYLPGGLGNANNWDERAPAYGFEVSSTPIVGSVGISNYGFYGHNMYVEAVNSDGTIDISDYNRAGTGMYSTSTISPDGLVFIYF